MRSCAAEEEYVCLMVERVLTGIEVQLEGGMRRRLVVGGHVCNLQSVVLAGTVLTMRRYLKIDFFRTKAIQLHRLVG